MITPHLFERDAQGDCRHCPLPERHPRAHIPMPPIEPTAEDPALAARLRDDGMDRALSGTAAMDWSVEAGNALAGLAADGREFTADDLIALVGLPKDSDPNANNAVGALFSGARARGLIEVVMVDAITPKTVKSKRALGHARRVSVWRGRMGY